MQVVGQNTHLGILLLLAPLAASEHREDLPNVLQYLTVDDARHVYGAIRIMEPGGMGDAKEQDVRDEPTATLLECMRLAADRDSIARQYASGFHDVFRFLDNLDATEFATWRSAILHLQLQIMAESPDTLIARKCGAEIAEESAARARAVLNCGVSADAVREFDDWLRADGHRRNPGTTADLVAATLFVALREDLISAPASLA